MSLHAFFVWCEHTVIGTAVRESIWLFPIIEVVHLLGLAVLGGAILLVDLRLLGIGLHGVPVASLARSARPWLWGSLALTIGSGVLLFLSEALKCYENPAFWLKVGFLIAGAPLRRPGAAALHARRRRRAAAVRGAPRRRGVRRAVDGRGRRRPRHRVLVMPMPTSRNPSILRPSSPPSCWRPPSAPPPSWP